MSALPLPSGTVTFLFTDVEGSTRLLQEHGPAYAEFLEERRRVMRKAFGRHDGVEVVLGAFEAHKPEVTAGSSSLT